MPFLIVCVAILSAGYLYHYYFKGDLTPVVKYVNKVIEIIVSEEGTSQSVVNKPIEDNTDDRVPAVSGDCSLQIDTDPRGAIVYVNGEKRNTTSTIVSDSCNSSIDLVLKRDGYEVISERIHLVKKQAKLYKTLKRIPMGELRLTLTRNADVYVDGKAIYEAEANKTFRLPLRAGQKYTLRFVNEILGIDVTRELAVEVDTVQRETIRLENP